MWLTADMGGSVDVPLPPGITGPEIRGKVRYVTHYGFTGAAPFRRLMR